MLRSLLAVLKAWLAAEQTADLDLLNFDLAGFGLLASAMARRAFLVEASAMGGSVICVHSPDVLGQIHHRREGLLMQGGNAQHLKLTLQVVLHQVRLMRQMGSFSGGKF